MKKILTIDGGGIKGIFPASFLSVVEDTIKESIYKYFDLIVGTSTGGIIALALGLGYSAMDTLTFYEENGPIIFSGNKFINSLKRLKSHKYEQKNLKDVLSKYFGTRKLGESKTRLVIPSFNLETGEVHIFKTAHHPRLLRDYKIPVVDVALATASAPTYFPVHRSLAGIPLVDGGIWANNPIAVGVVEGMSILNWKREEMFILSLGCTSECLSIKWNLLDLFGLGYWGYKISDIYLAAQSSSANGIANLLIGPQNVYRFNPFFEKGRFVLDNAEKIISLKGLGDSEARKAIPNILHFFEKHADEFKTFNT